MTRSREVSKGATRVEFVYTATAGQTSFSGNDANSNSLAYTVGQIDVFLNGVRLAAADITASNGTAVVLGVGAEAGDTLNINAFGTFSVADVLVARVEFDYTATAGQTTFTGSDNDSQTMAYVAGRIDVYLNGSHLMDTDDYVATNGTSVVLQAGSQVGDTIQVITHGTVNLISHIPDAAIDMNGLELILDADGDTSITADTDDQIDFRAGGGDVISITPTGISGNDKIISRVNLLDIGIVTNAIGAIGGGAQAIDLSLGNSVSATVDTGTTTFTFTNPTAADECNIWSLILTNGGSQTVNYPSSVDWEGGTVPTLTASGVDILVFLTIDAGTTWHGQVYSSDSKSPS
mgnify:CR=1 FL=1